VQHFMGGDLSATQLRQATVALGVTGRGGVADGLNGAGVASTSRT
jgi:hypothetical protein